MEDCDYLKVRGSFSFEASYSIKDTKVHTINEWKGIYIGRKGTLSKRIQVCREYQRKPYDIFYSSVGAKSCFYRD